MLDLIPRLVLTFRVFLQLDLNMEIKGRDKAIKYTTSIGRAFPDMTITNTVFERDEAEIDVVKMKFDMLGTHVSSSPPACCFLPHSDFSL
jgi:hypothetical protein